MRNRYFRDSKPAVTVLLLFLLFFFSSCGEKGRRETAGNAQFMDETIEVVFKGGRVVVAEVVDTEEEKRKGLMFRKKLDPSGGMVFIYGEDGFYPFWMKNTLIPLDILWLKEEGGGEVRVVYLHKNARPCREEPCRNYFPMMAARYVLEVNAGFIDHEGIKAGDKARINWGDYAYQGD